MRYLSTTQVGEKWNCSPRWVAELCEGGRIKGAQKAGSTWIIPEDADRPADARIKSGRYIKKRDEGISLQLALLPLRNSP